MVTNLGVGLGEPGKVFDCSRAGSSIRTSQFHEACLEVSAHHSPIHKLPSQAFGRPGAGLSLLAEYSTGGIPSGSASKEVTCTAGDPGSILGPGKIPWRRDRLCTPVFLGFPGGSAGKESACSGGALGLIPGLGRFPGEGNSYLLQNSGLENSMGSQRVRHV